AELISSGDRAHVYDKREMVRRMLMTQGYTAGQIPADLDPDSPQYQWYRYYNPPAYLFALAPLTLLDARSAYLVTVGINILLAAILALMLGMVLRWRQPHSSLLIAGLFAFNPL